MFEVVVGNIGIVYSGTSRREANKRFADYVRSSKIGLGKSANETVQLIRHTGNADSVWLEVVSEFSPLAWRIAKLEATIAQLERHLQMARETREELIHDNT